MKTEEILKKFEAWWQVHYGYSASAVWSAAWKACERSLDKNRVLVPLDSLTAKEWRRCAIYHEERSYKVGTERDKLRKQLAAADAVIDFYADELEDYGKSAREYQRKYKGERDDEP